MPPVNKAIDRSGVMLQKTRDTIFIPSVFHSNYRRHLLEVESNPGKFKIFREERYEAGEHPDSFIDHECAFASRFFSNRAHDFCSLDGLSDSPEVWDVYFGCSRGPP